MTAQLTETSEREESDDGSAADRIISAVRRRGLSGPVATFLGGVTLLRTLTGPRTNRARQAARLAVGGALFAVGLRRLRAERTGERDGTDGAASAGGSESGESEVSDDAHAEANQDLGAQRVADERGSVYQSETEPNPRGMTDRDDVEEAQDQEGDVHFVEGEQPEAHRETHLEDDDAHDTRLHPDSDDESTEVDLSEAAMADEISEAAGPHPEQSYPSQEGTDPEPTSPDAPERVGEGAVAQTGPESGDEDTDAATDAETDLDVDEDERAGDEGVGDESDDGTGAEDTSNGSTNDGGESNDE